MPKIAIIIPCYNESKRLDTERFNTFLQNHADVKFFFVDDGSTDATTRILEDIRKLAPGRSEIISIFPNKGKAEAVRAGLQESIKDKTTMYHGFLDADLALPLEEFYRLFNILSSTNNKFIFGSRIKKLGSSIKRNEWRHFLGRFIATIVGLITQVNAYDTQCSAKIFHSDIVPVFAQRPFRTQWLFDVEIICRMQNDLGELRLIGHEEPLIEWTDIQGSKLRWLDTFKIMKEIAIIYKYYRSNKPSSHT